MKKYVIKKGKRYWKKNNLGYSENISDAKIFTEVEATKIINRPNSDKTMHEL